MHTVSLLEKLATTVHHDSAIHTWLSEQPAAIQHAFQTNDANALKNHLGSGMTLYLADRTTVVDLSL